MPRAWLRVRTGGKERGVESWGGSGGQCGWPRTRAPRTALGGAGVEAGAAGSRGPVGSGGSGRQGRGRRTEGQGAAGEGSGLGGPGTPTPWAGDPGG